MECEDLLLVEKISEDDDDDNNEGEDKTFTCYVMWAGWRIFIYGIFKDKEIIMRRVALATQQ